jgi:YVTN family beta-propeller protein
MCRLRALRTFRASVVVASCAVAITLLAWMPAQALAGAAVYVVSTGTDTVSIVDVASNTVADTIAVGVDPVRIAASSDGSRAYVANAGSDSISVIDVAQRQVVGTIALASSPGSLVVTPDGAALYVMIEGGQVAVVDTASASVTTAITVGPADLGFLGGGGGIAVSDDGARVYVTWGELSVIDTATNTVVASNYVGICPTEIALSHDGAGVYVANNFGTDTFTFDGQVLDVDVATVTTDETIQFWSLPSSLVLSPDGSLAYVASVAVFVNTGYGAAFIPDKSLVVLDLTTNTEVTRIQLGSTPSRVAITPDGALVYVTIAGSDAVAVIDTETNSVFESIAVSDAPTGLVVIDQPGACVGDLVSGATFAPPGDQRVDGADLACMLGAWGRNPGSAADLVTTATLQPPADGYVNAADLAVLLGAWGECP